MVHARPHAVHVHIPEVEHRQGVAKIRGGAEARQRVDFVPSHAPAHQRAISEVPLRLRDAARRHVPLHLDLRVAVLNLLVADPPGVPLPVAKTSGFAR